MRSKQQIERDIAVIKQTIKEIRQDGDVDNELELFYQDLEELEEELHSD